jgi:hypothetical protein
MNFDMVVSRRLLFYLLTLILAVAAFATAQMPAVEGTSQSGGTAPSPTTTASPDDGWHVGVTPYIWFAGVHGTAGALGFQTSVHATFGDIFNYLNNGRPGSPQETSFVDY